MFTRVSKALLTSAVLGPQMALIKTFAFLDLETTGLPSMENNRTKITELTLLAVQSQHLACGVVPRVQNKLTLCFNPLKMISLDSEHITGLSNYDLEHLGSFTSSTVEMINRFLEHSPKPVCLVAHNGNRFDYPILKAEIAKTGANLIENILCIDSLETFRKLHEGQLTQPTDTPDSAPLEFQDGFDEILCQALDEYEGTDPTKKGLKRALEQQKINEKTPKKAPNVLGTDLDLGPGVIAKRGCFEAGPSNGKNLKSRKKLNYGISFKLGDVYKRLTNKESTNAHQAENDVIMLAMCAATLGDQFIRWANENARKFGDVPAMAPGKRIGT